MRVTVSEAAIDMRIGMASIVEIGWRVLSS